MPFVLDLPPLEDTADTTAMVATHRGGDQAQARPRPTILARDARRGHVTDLRWLTDGRLAAAFGGEHVSSARGVQLRDGDALTLVTTVEGVGGPLALGSRVLVGAGPRYGGFDASVCVVDLDAMEVADTLPLRPPVCTLVDGEDLLLIGAPPSRLRVPQSDGTVKDGGLAVPRRLLESVEGAAALTDQRGPVVLDLSSRRARALGGDPVDPDGEADLIAIAGPDAERGVYAITREWAARIDADGVTWRRKLAAYDAESNHGLQALALDAGRRRLALSHRRGDGAHLTLLEAASGELVAERHLHTRASSALAFHPTGWLAVGFEDGTLVFVDAEGHRRTFKGARGAIYALCFTPEGDALLVGGRDKGLRRYPLLDDESGLAITT